MAGVRDKALLRYAGFPLGMNNTARETAMPTDENGAQIGLREAVNIDIGAEGKPRRRAGYEQVYAGPHHSAWSDPYMPFGLVVAGDTLYAVHDDDSRVELATGLALGQPVSYARVNDVVLWSNEVQCGQVNLALQMNQWSAPNPQALPSLVVAGGGALTAGLYQVTVTLFDAAGRESGAPQPAAIDVPANSSILLQGLPQPPAGGEIRVYATDGQNAVLRAATTLPAGTTEYTLSAPPTGRPCDTIGLRRMLPGQLVAAGNGRQFVARGAEVLYSPVLRYGLFDPRYDRVGFVGRVTLLAFVGDGSDGAGLFVADAKRTYFLGGANPAQWSQRIAHAHGVVPGSLAMMPGDVWGIETQQPLPVWMSTNGRLCVGLPGGQIMQPQPRDGQPDAVFDRADAAAMIFKETAGDRRVVAALRNPGRQSFAMRDQLIVREYRHDGTSA